VASTDVSSSIAKLLRLASWVICLIVLASFLVFVVDQTSAASTHQQEAIHGGGSSAGTSGTSKQKSSLHRTIDEASDFFTSPFAGVVSGSNSQWLIHGVKTVLALLVYGFALSYLARVIRVRV
jgi:hypothetical protein